MVVTLATKGLARSKEPYHCAQIEPTLACRHPATVVTLSARSLVHSEEAATSEFPS